MNDRRNAAEQDPLELVVDLLKLARKVEPMTSKEIDRRLSSFSGPKLDHPSSNLDRALGSASARLRSLWNRLRRESDGEPAWTDEWMPSWMHVERWALSVERREPCRLWTVEFLEKLKDRLIQSAAQPPLIDEQAETAPGPGDVARPAEPDTEGQAALAWETLPETCQRILRAIGNRTMLGKNIASAIDPQWTHDSIGKQLSALVKAGVLQKVGTRSGYRVARLPPGTPFELNDSERAE